MANTSDEPHGLSIPVFEETLQNAVDQRSRVYSFVSSLSVRWENDQTNAKADREKFRDIVHLLGFPTPELYVIPLQDRTSGWILNRKIHLMIDQGLAAEGRALLGILNQVESDYCYLLPDSEINVIFILDSCFSHVATRNTVNAQLVERIMARKTAGYKSVGLAELVDSLIEKSPQVTPSYKLLVGVHSLRLELSGSVSNVVPPPVVAPEYFAVFVHVAKSLSKSALAKMAEWIHALPWNIGLTLENVYESSSWTFIFRSSRYMFLKLNGLNYVTLVCTTRLPNLVSRFHTLKHRRPQSKSRSTT
ncbi:hypothetical protein BDV23DRAFT_170977 [Aspergillus alliaceus]|uniref:Uncharacterized protein n=1 Tax=Petromyces alliaceus TaxID=209559 RepID=A0A5N7CF09_PETAA|nr:hypothetical protein BDV23DRAFT_170977 [Aspergillus alliaceus]